MSISVITFGRVCCCNDDRYAQLTRGALIINYFLQNPHFSHLTLISVKKFKTKQHRYMKIHTFFIKFSKLNDRHCTMLLSLFWPFKSTICPIVKRVRTKRTPASSYFFLFYYHRGKHKVGWHKTFFGPTHYFTLRNSYILQAKWCHLACFQPRHSIYIAQCQIWLLLFPHFHQNMM